MASILRRGKDSEIIIRQRPREDFSARFPGAWPYERNEAMAAALSDDKIHGARETRMKEPGEVWAFWFYFLSVKLYGKINLTPGGRIIIVYSAHVPLKGEESL